MRKAGQSLLQQLNRHILMAIGVVAVTIFAIANFSYWKNNQAFGVSHQQILQRHIALHAPSIEKDWRQRLNATTNAFNSDQLSAWLSPLRYPDTQITLLHRNQPVFSLTSDAPLPSEVSYWKGEHLITADLPLDGGYHLHITQYHAYPTPYLQFMTRPLMAVTVAGIVLWLFVGLWAKRQQKDFSTLKRAITLYRQNQLNEAENALKQLTAQKGFRRS